MVHTESPLIFGKYRIIRRLAVGGMGEIFLARQGGLAGFDRLVILKGLLPDLARDPRCVDEFLDEARIAATLNHPNIVSIYEVGLWDGVYFIAMEYVDGESLSSLVPLGEGGARRMLPIPAAARIVHDAALALHHAHSAIGADGRTIHVVHRDVSPQNIMVRLDGVTKVLDFGIAKAANRSSRTATGVIKGKVRYMPPEQLAGGPLDGRSDQYSLGVVLWEMCTGERLFKNDLHVAERLTGAPILPPSTVASHVPEDVSAIALRMLEPDPKARFSSCLEVAQALAKVLERAGSEGDISVVARIVREVAGQAIKERTRDLTPRADNFFVSLTPNPADAGGRGQRRVLIGVALLTVLAVLALLLAPSAGRRRIPVVAHVDRSPPNTQIEERVTAPRDAAVIDAPTEPARGEREGGAPIPTSEAKTKGIERREKDKPVRLRTDPTTPSTNREGARALPVAIGYLSLDTVPWTKVYIDGRFSGTTALFKVAVPVGVHEARLVNEESSIDHRTKFEIKSDVVTKMSLDLTK